MPGVVEVSVHDGVVEVVVEGSVDPVIKAAAAIEVTRVVTHNDDLEDIFLALTRTPPRAEGGTGTEPPK